MYKVRVAFSKQSYAKYISHLDLMRMFQRAFRKAEIDIAFSQGFNPHPKMSIGHPIPIGVTGSEEYMDMVLQSAPDFEQLKMDLNNALPRDIRVLRTEEPMEPLNLLVWAAYTAQLDVVHPLPEFADYMCALEKKSDIVVAKKTKKGISNVDIKPAIGKLELLDRTGDTHFVLRMVLSCKEGSNLKATSILDAFRKYIPDFEVDQCLINRDGLYKENLTKIR